MARFGGPFYLCQSIPNAYKKKRRFDNALHEFRYRLPRIAKNSAAHEWHMTAHERLDERRRLEIAFRFECEVRKRTDRRASQGLTVTADQTVTLGL